MKAMGATSRELTGVRRTHSTALAGSEDSCRLVPALKDIGGRGSGAGLGGVSELHCSFFDLLLSSSVKWDGGR